MSEYEIEPIPGLPGHLPPGEYVIWQGSPDWRGMALRAFHVRGFAIYFGILIVVALATGSTLGIALTFGGAALGLAIIAGLAWLSAWTTIYTLTNKRVVFRYGMALQKCVNLPLVAIGNVAVTIDSQGRADIPLELSAKHQLGYLQFWPHVRPWKLAVPEPMMRAVPDGMHVAQLLGSAIRANGQVVETRNGIYSHLEISISKALAA